MTNRSLGTRPDGKSSIDPRRGPIVHISSPDKRRPVLVLTRDETVDCLNEIIAAPVTRTIRGLRTEVLLTEEDGSPLPGQRDRFGSVLCTLPEQRWPEARKALLTACGFDQD